MISNFPIGKTPVQRGAWKQAYLLPKNWRDLPPETSAPAAFYAPFYLVRLAIVYRVKFVNQKKILNLESKQLTKYVSHMRIVFFKEISRIRRQFIHRNANWINSMPSFWIWDASGATCKAQMLSISATHISVITTVKITINTTYQLL